MKEFAPSQEKLFYGGKNKRLAKTLGRLEEDAPIRLEHQEDAIGLVALKISASYDFIECLNTDGLEKTLPFLISIRPIR